MIKLLIENSINNKIHIKQIQIMENLKIKTVLMVR